MTLVRDIARSVDPAKKTVTLGGGQTIGYDKLILSPGIDLQFDAVEGLRAAHPGVAFALQQAVGEDPRVTELIAKIALE